MRLVPEQTGRLNEQLTFACGPVVLWAIGQPGIEDLALNPDGSLWMKARGDWVKIGQIEEDAAWEIVSAVAAIRHRPLNDEHPVLETTSPLDGSRFTAVIPPITQRPIFSIRLLRKSGWNFTDYEKQGVLTHGADPDNNPNTAEDFAAAMKGKPYADTLRAAVLQRKSVLYVGPTGSGKTTIADAHLNEIGALTSDRVIYVEDTQELECDVPNAVGLLANDSFSMRDCVRAAMRLRPKRLTVGECRGGEALDLLRAWGTGHPGGIATIHADDAYSGLTRMESLVAEATSAPQQQLIAQAIHLVVFIEEDKKSPAGRKVREVIAVTGYSGGRYQFVKL